MNERERVALFIDLENVVTSLWKGYQQSLDLFEILEKVRKHGQLAFGRAYGDFTQPSISRLESDLRALGIDKFDCKVKQNGQSTVDSNIVMDLYEVALDQPSVGTYVLMAGDSDYIRVVAKLRQRLDKKIIIMGVPGTVSRELVRAAGNDDPLQPMALSVTNDAAIIRLIDRFEATRREGTLPSFRFLMEYVSHPSNAEVIRPQVVNAKLSEYVQQGILVQATEQTYEGVTVKTTRLDRAHPTVIEAFTTI